jgi:uncharacterized protein (DUF849 family)
VLKRGGNLSIGLYDYHYREDSDEPTKVDLVRGAVSVAAEVGRKSAKPADTRKILKLETLASLA